MTGLERRRVSCHIPQPRVVLPGAAWGRDGRTASRRGHQRRVAGCRHKRPTHAGRRHVQTAAPRSSAGRVANTMLAGPTTNLLAAAVPPASSVTKIDSTAQQRGYRKRRWFTEASGSLQRSQRTARGAGRARETPGTTDKQTHLCGYRYHTWRGGWVQP